MRGGKPSPVNYRSAFDHCNQNKVQAAKLRGVSRNVVRHRLRQYGLI